MQSSYRVPLQQIIPQAAPGQPRDGQADELEMRLAEALEQRWQRALGELQQERQTMLAQVEAERARTLAEAEQRGLAAGHDKARAEADRLMQEVHSAYRQLETDRIDYIAACQREISDLAVDIAREILQTELQSSPESLLEVARRAISELISKKRTVVFVHPDNVATVSSYSYLLPDLPDGSEALVRPDPSLSLYSLRAEDEMGAVVVDLPRELQRVREALHDD